jgi:hypothetical protein
MHSFGAGLGNIGTGFRQGERTACGPMLKLPFRCPLLSLPEAAAPEQTAVSVIYLSSAEVQIPATFSNDSILVLLSPLSCQGRYCVGPGTSMAAVTPRLLANATHGTAAPHGACPGSGRCGLSLELLVGA